MDFPPARQHAGAADDAPALAGFQVHGGGIGRKLIEAGFKFNGRPAEERAATSDMPAAQRLSGSAQLGGHVAASSRFDPSAACPELAGDAENGRQRTARTWEREALQTLSGFAVRESNANDGTPPKASVPAPEAARAIARRSWVANPRAAASARRAVLKADHRCRQTRAAVVTA
jgi:hypothetical protein